MTKMWHDLGASWAILLGIGFMMLANGLQGTLLGVRAMIEGFSTFTTGIVMAGYFIGVFIGSFVAPILVKRVGHIRVFSALASLASISILFHGVYIDPVIWWLMRVVTGIAFAGFYVVTESWLNDRASNETRGKVLSVYMVIVTGGMGLGQFLLNVAAPEDIDLFIMISIIISAGLIPVLLTARPAPAFETSAKMSMLELYRASPLAVIGNCLTGMAHGTIFGLGAIYARVVLVDVRSISLFMACFLLGSLVTQWPIGYLSDHVGRRAVMAALSGISIACCIAALVIPPGGIAFYLVMVALGGAAVPMYSLCIAHANDRLAPEQIVAASGSLVMIAGIGLMTGPVAISFFMDLIGVEFFFWGIATVFAVLLLVTMFRISSSRGVASAEMSHVVVGPIGTPIAEYTAFAPVEYAEAAARHELDRLDLQEDITERRL